MENALYLKLKPLYPELKEYEVIIDIPEPINFESHIAIIDDDNQVKDISDSDMVFNCELSHLFQHSLRKVALYTPEYVNKEDAKLALSKYLYE